MLPVQDGAQMGGPLQQPGVDVEDVAGVGLAPRRAAQQERELAVGPGVAGQIIVDHQHVAALLHEVLAHGGGGVGGDELEPRRVLAGGADQDAVLEGAVALEALHRPGYRGAPLADGAVDAEHVLVALVDDRVQGHRGLAGLAVADDQLPLAAADGDHGVHGLDAGLQGRAHRRPVHDGRGRPLQGPALGDAQRTLPVQGAAGGVDHPPDQPLAHRRVRLTSGGVHPHPRGQVVAGTEEDHPDPVRVQVDRESQHAAGEGDQLLGADAAQAVHPGDSPAHLRDGADVAQLGAGREAGDGGADRGEGVVEQVLQQVHGDGSTLLRLAGGPRCAQALAHPVLEAVQVVRQAPAQAPAAGGELDAAQQLR